MAAIRHWGWFVGVLLIGVGSRPLAAVMLNVPFFSQYDCGDEKLLGPSDGTIAVYGCALTSAAMVMNYYGVSTGPCTLNDELLALGGVFIETGPDAGAFADWDRIRLISDGIVSGMERIADPELSDVDTALRQGYPPIAHVRFGAEPTGHFIVFWGNEGGQHYFYDPADHSETPRIWPNGAQGRVYSLGASIRIYQSSELPSYTIYNCQFVGAALLTQAVLDGTSVYVPGYWSINKVDYREGNEWHVTCQDGWYGVGPGGSDAWKDLQEFASSHEDGEYLAYGSADGSYLFFTVTDHSWVQRLYNCQFQGAALDRDAELHWKSVYLRGLWSINRVDQRDGANWYATCQDGWYGDTATAGWKDLEEFASTHEDGEYLAFGGYDNSYLFFSVSGHSWVQRIYNCIQPGGGILMKEADLDGTSVCLPGYWSINKIDSRDGANWHTTCQEGWYGPGPVGSDPWKDLQEFAGTHEDGDYLAYGIADGSYLFFTVTDHSWVQRLYNCQFQGAALDRDAELHWKSVYLRGLWSINRVDQRDGANWYATCQDGWYGDTATAGWKDLEEFASTHEDGEYLAYGGADGSYLFFTVTDHSWIQRIYNCIQPGGGILMKEADLDGTSVCLPGYWSINKIDSRDGANWHTTCQEGWYGPGPVGSDPWKDLQEFAGTHEDGDYLAYGTADGSYLFFSVSDHILIPPSGPEPPDSPISDEEYLLLSTWLFGEERAVTGKWGVEPWPVTGRHTGVDYGAPTGTTVYAATRGEVIRVERGMDGQTLECLSTLSIYNADTDASFLYLHMEAITADVGMQVQTGEVLGSVGQRGPATGPHLHFEARAGQKGYAALTYDATVNPYQTAADARTVSPEPPISDDVYWLAKALVNEAGGQTAIEEAAVGWTVLNRLNYPWRFADTVEGVVNQPYQYADNWTLPHKEPDDNALATARALLQGTISDPTNGATHFFSPCSMTTGRGPYPVPSTSSTALYPWWAEPSSDGWGMLNDNTAHYVTIDNTEWRLWEGIRPWYFMFYRPYVLSVRAKIMSPGELRVYDSEGRITGLVSGSIVTEIPGSQYSGGEVLVPFPTGFCRYQIAGTSVGTYGLAITAATRDGDISFVATEMPTASGTQHEYSLDWDRLSQDQQGVSLAVDAEGDGVFEQTITAGPILESPQISVGNMVSISSGQASYNRRTGRFSVNVTVRNTSSTVIGGPIWLVIDSVSTSSVYPTSTSGTTEDGKPYVDLSSLAGNGTLEPAETIQARVYFSNPQRQGFTFTASVRGVISQ